MMDNKCQACPEVLQFFSLLYIFFISQILRIVLNQISVLPGFSYYYNIFPTGPLFSFDVHDDIRLVNDATVEKDEVSL